MRAAVHFWSRNLSQGGPALDADLRLALFWAWLIASVPALLAAVAPFVLPASSIQAVTPVCVWKAQLGRECLGCGLTTAFIHIGHFEWGEAVRAHRGSLAVFALFVINSVLAIRAGSRLLGR